MAVDPHWEHKALQLIEALTLHFTFDPSATPEQRADVRGAVIHALEQKWTSENDKIGNMIDAAEASKIFGGRVFHDLLWLITSRNQKEAASVQSAAVVMARSPKVYSV